LPAFSNEQIALFARFALSGISTTALYYVLVLVAAEGFGANEVTASGASYAVCIAVSYLAQSRFAFRVATDTPSQIGRFVVVSLAGLATSVMVMEWAVEAGLRPWLGALIVSAAIPMANFLVYTFWVFYPTQRDRA
jgi:putative flippase GtrA